ncbi:hypothetical protein NUW58_g3168 [Xylaria curta]|uniref:Uncharacterized protein n=1 Tax=Xylaria curta TaxID=42375 RepID=A0ACC1PCR1_9PEZI|nr:hypothetical protein NUW58_g3168 [Xylaria curta]
MLSLSSLLNPAPPGPSHGSTFPPSPESSSPTDSCVEDCVLSDRSTMPKHKMPKDAAVFTKSKPKGAINFQPHEDLDEVSLHRVRRFQVYPLGKIREYSRHIPYNSGKKDFFEKTGRESFEVFQYVFKVPGDDAEYAVMWDYNIGLVRMTPFFKCCKYPKTTPAKMLNSNPGLKEITHSITGGSIMAQGYWMPYQCAKAVCATFCHNISGALIPIFGPEFPALCTQVDAPEYSRMVIDPAIVIRSTREAEYYRRLYNSTSSLDSGSRSDNGIVSPKLDRYAFHDPYDDSSRHGPRYRTRKAYITTIGNENSPYTTDTDGEISPVTDRSDLSRDHHQHNRLPRFPHSPIPSMITPLRSSHTSSSGNGWTPVNVPHLPGQLRPHAEYQTSGPSPWLSAIPRFTTTAHSQGPPYPSSNTPKPPRSQPYPLSRPFSQSQSYSQTYHHPGTAHRQLPSPSNAPPHSSQQVPQPSPRAKRPAAQIEDDTQLDHHHLATIPGQNKVLQHNCTTPWVVLANVGADKNAALLLMNLSVRDHSSLWSLKKSRNTEAPDVSGFPGARDNRYSGNDSNYRANLRSPNGDSGGGRGCHARPQAGASATTKPGGEGTPPETSPPLGGAFPRIKRVRSNSM